MGLYDYKFDCRHGGPQHVSPVPSAQRSLLRFVIRFPGKALWLFSPVCMLSVAVFLPYGTIPGG